jgi:hypothetical protein
MPLCADYLPPATSIDKDTSTEEVLYLAEDGQAWQLYRIREAARGLPEWHLVTVGDLYR